MKQSDNKIVPKDSPPDKSWVSSDPIGNTIPFIWDKKSWRKVSYVLERTGCKKLSNYILLALQDTLFIWE